MNKIFTLAVLAAAMLISAPACAQDDEEMDDTFIFTDSLGNEVKDGSTVVLDQFDGKQISTGLYIKNTIGARAAGSISENISEMPNGTFSSCAFGQCLMPWTTAGTYESYQGVIEGDAGIQPITTEWIPADGGYATWTATLQINVREVAQKTMFGVTTYSAGEIIGTGPKLTLNFVYKDPTGINGVSAKAANEPVAYYSLGGARLSKMQNGVNIVRYADGTTRKIVK